MSDSESTSHRQQDLYLTEVYQLLVALDYMRRYRTFLARRVTWFGALRAIASSTAIGAWAVWQSYPMVWGGVIAAAQVADALKDVFPFTARTGRPTTLSSLSRLSGSRHCMRRSVSMQVSLPMTRLLNCGVS
jgi:hypothetical protein